MGSRAILRLFHKRVESSGVEELESPLTRYFGGEAYTVDVYTVKLDSLIIQYPDSPDAYRYTGPVEFSKPPWRTFCRWHNAPLSVRDNPWERLYCTVESEGYCRYHRRSERALYDTCMSMRSEAGLDACRRLDSIVKTEYTLYMTETGGRSIKVGVTRSFRLLERISEQPHSVATILAVYDSAYQARRAEITISRSGLAGESSPRKVRRPDPVTGAPLLYTMADRASKLLGVSWSGRLFRVKPDTRLLEARQIPPGKLAGHKGYIEGYWGGFILFNSPNNTSIIKVRELIHRDVLVIE